MPNVMATLWIQVALSVENNQERKFRNSIFVPRPKIWLASTARVPCSNSASIGKRKTWAQSEFCTWQNSVRDKSRQNCIYSVPAKETAKHRTKFGSVEWCRCNNEDNTWKPLKFAGVPKTRQSISAVSTPKFVILWGHVEEILLFKSFSDCRYMPYLRRYSPTKLCDGDFVSNYCVLYFQLAACSTFETRILNSR